MEIFEFSIQNFQIFMKKKSDALVRSVNTIIILQIIERTFGIRNWYVKTL
jgi:hypothetical protein